MQESPPEKSANRLARESSAYLLQHSQNPVDWYAWGDEALERAHKLDRPILLSIGYSACHWCHVMERESFEDEATADLMNASFVCIKVDREERPDLDQIYMDAVTKLNQGQGGWPLTAFCLPDGSPFYGGSYYPKQAGQGLPAFEQVLRGLADAYANRRGEVENAARQIVASLDLELDENPASAKASKSVAEAARSLLQNADRERGGFGSGPKFPSPPNLEFLIAALDLVAADAAQEISVQLDLSAREMSRRGLFDHLAGGFHRYCVDGDWTIPHFEKMLYDQGLLLRFYSEWLRRGADVEDFAWPIRETIDYLRREMTSPEGGFYASQDADAEGREGAFHVWTPDQVREVLGRRADAFCRAHGVTTEGNFEGGTSQLLDLERGPREAFATERGELLSARQGREAPETDRKRVAAWNAYAISGLARASSVLGDDSILGDAVHAMDFILDEMVDTSGRLHRIFNRGSASIPAFLDDHAALLDACLDLYRAGAPERFLTAALHFAQEIGDRFFDAKSGTLFFTAHDAEKLVTRPRTDHDGATPSALGLAAVGLCRLAQLSRLAPIQQQLDRILLSQGELLERCPHAAPTLLRALALRERGGAVAIIIGDSRDARSHALAARARRLLCPDDAVVVLEPGEARPTGVASAWLRDRQPVNGEPTAWICRGNHCSLPATDPKELTITGSPITGSPITGSPITGPPIR
jgi:uncharacterized protein YyaL (SSP411 family)